MTYMGTKVYDQFKANVGWTENPPPPPPTLAHPMEVESNKILKVSKTLLN